MCDVLRRAHSSLVKQQHAGGAACVMLCMLAMCDILNPKGRDPLAPSFGYTRQEHDTCCHKTKKEEKKKCEGQKRRRRRRKHSIACTQRKQRTRVA
jgi:hypothetical protein